MTPATAEPSVSRPMVEVQWGHHSSGATCRDVSGWPDPAGGGAAGPPSFVPWVGPTDRRGPTNLGRISGATVAVGPSLELVVAPLVARLAGAVPVGLAESLGRPSRCRSAVARGSRCAGYARPGRARPPSGRGPALPLR